MSLYVEKVKLVSDLAKSELDVASSLANDLAGLTGIS